MNKTIYFIDLSQLVGVLEEHRCKVGVPVEEQNLARKLAKILEKVQDLSKAKIVLEYDKIGMSFFKVTIIHEGLETVFKDSLIFFDLLKHSK